MRRRFGAEFSPDHVTLPGRRGGQPSWHDGRGAHCTRTGDAAARASRAGAAVPGARLGRADVSRRAADPRRRRRTPFCLPFHRLTVGIACTTPFTHSCERISVFVVFVNDNTHGVLVKRHHCRRELRCYGSGTQQHIPPAALSPNTLNQLTEQPSAPCLRRKVLL